MLKQLEEVDNKIKRLNDDTDLITKYINKLNKLKEEYDNKKTYYKECMVSLEKKYDADRELISNKIKDKHNKKQNMLNITYEYKKTVENNIKNLVAKAKEDNVNLE